MKSIIFLLVTTCCLFPFSSATFTSDNPIILPTTTHDDNIVLPEILDSDGDPLKTGQKYIIRNPLIGGGDVYWGSIGDTICPNSVLQHISSRTDIGPGTPVKFVLNPYDADDGRVIREMFAVNIMFSVETCVDETVWKVDDENFVVTGGTLGNKNIFRIQEYPGRRMPGIENVYKLLYCPNQIMCEDVSGIIANGHSRLAVVAKKTLPFIFVKEKNA